MKKKLHLIALCMCFLTTACADMKTAKLAYQSGDYTTARQNLTVLADHGFPEAQTKLGEMTMAGLGAPADQQKAISLFNQAIQENDTGGMVALGKAYSEGEGVPLDRAKARELFNQALALNDPHAYLQLGLLEENENNLPGAEGDYTKALQAGYIKSWYQLGVLAEMKGNLDLADQYYSNAVASGDTMAYYHIGRLHMKLRLFAQAEKDFMRTIDTVQAQAYFKQGLQHQNAQQAESAVDDFNNAAALGARPAWRHLGDIYTAQNKLDQAEEAYDKAAAAGDTTVYTNLGKLHEKMGKNDLAEKDFAKAKSISDNQAYSSLENMDNTLLADQAFATSVSVGADGVYLPLGDAQSAQGKFALAYDNYQKAMSEGNHKAYVRVAEMYRKGEGRPVDNVQALTYLFRARKLGVPDLDTKIAHLEKKLQPDGLAKAYDLVKGDVE